MQYGMPYMGSKSKIAEWIIDILPEGKVLVDAFGGGGAITHCAFLSGKWDKVIYNELEPLIVKGFRMAVNGEFKNEDRWVSREMFELLKDEEPYVALCYSFGNNKEKGYCYSREIEPVKKSLHKAILSKEPKQRRLAFKNCIRLTIEQQQGVEGLKKIQQFESLERLERLQSLERLERLQSLEIIQGSYDDIVIPEGAVIYCDIPYKNTNEYSTSFDYDEFYEWALNQDSFVFISEYEMPKGFYLVGEQEKLSTMSSASNSINTVERLFCNKEYKPKKVEQMSLI